MESIKKIITEDNEDIIEQAVDAAMGIRMIVDKAIESFAWDTSDFTPLQESLVNLNDAIFAVYRNSRYGEEYRRNVEQWQHEQD